MEKLFLLSAFVMVTFCSKDYQHFCHNLDCPEYEATEKNKYYEVRMYVATSWITTKISTTQQQGILDAHSRLKEYCNNHGETGERIKKTWPALITRTEEGHFLSWFVPPDVSAQDDPKYSVKVTTVPAGKFCVRSFDGIPSFEKGEENVKILQHSCGHAKDMQTYMGAAYDPFVSFTHYNEVWIKAD